MLGRTGILFVVGCGLCVLAIGLLLWNDAACIMFASPPSASGDPRYLQEVNLVPLRWECQWLDIEGTPTTFYVNPTSTGLYGAGLVSLAASAVSLVLMLVRRGRGEDAARVWS